MHGMLMVLDEMPATFFMLAGGTGHYAVFNPFSPQFYRRIDIATV